MGSGTDGEGVSRGGDRESNPEISDATALAALDQLTADPQFHVSDRNRRFLRFVVEETLAGRRDRIKAYSIAIDVFGRGAEFDGRLDPIVRIEATRLRAALSAYYAGPGRDHRVHIQLPKGGYVPHFERSNSTASVLDAEPHFHRAGDAPQASPKEQTARGLAPPFMTKRNSLALAGLLILLGIVASGATLLIRSKAAPLTSPPTIIVKAGQLAAADGISDQISTGFMQSLTVALSRFDGIWVLNLPRDLSLPAAIDKLAAGGEAQGAVYALETSVRRDDQLIRFSWKLSDARTEKTMWTDVADRVVSEGMTIPVEDEIAGKLATVIGQPQGLIATREIGIQRTYPTNGYGCVLRARAYYLAISEALHRAVRDCLEQTVAVAPDYAEAWAMLAFVYLDEDRNNFNRRTTAEDALARAISSAHRAAELAPNSESAQEALVAVLYRKGDFDTAFAAGRRALEINPHNPELMSLVGTRMFARGQWDEGAALVRNSIKQVLVIPPLDRVTLVLDAYRKRDFTAALEQAQLIDLPDYYAAPLLRAAIYGELGRAPEARKSVEALLAIRPSYASEMRPELRSRHYTEPLIDMLADGLRKAGLPVQ
jgi:adenylate cyclase